MRKHSAKYLFLLSGLLMFCVSCDLLFPNYPQRDAIPPLPPAVLIAR